MYLALKNVKMTAKYLNYSGTDFCPLKPEIAPSSIAFPLKHLALLSGAQLTVT